MPFPAMEDIVRLESSVLHLLGLKLQDHIERPSIKLLQNPPSRQVHTLTSYAQQRAGEAALCALHDTTLIPSQLTYWPNLRLDEESYHLFFHSIENHALSGQDPRRFH